jgi:hypothetical protein
MASKISQQSGATIKQERESRRLEKVEAFKRQQSRQRRNRRIAIASSIVGGVAVLAVIVTAIALSAQPKVDPKSIEIAGLKTFPGLHGGVHVDPTPVDYQADYGMNPPAGGDHFAVWLNCGVYSEPVPNENAVHDLEHGAVWITYDPAALTADEIATLQKAGPDTYLVISPYPGLPAPVVVSAWGAQVQLDGVDDPRLDQFISKYWMAATAPEPGSPCTGGLEGPGRVG